MNTTNKCPECGAPLPPHAPEGLCPRCLMAMNLATPTIINEDGTTVRVKFEAPKLEEIVSLFPHLENIELLGQGGMGVVYMARQTKLDRIVALKILPKEIGETAGFAERFAREARVLGKLNHPNIVTLHEFGHVDMEDGEPLYYFLMEYVDGLNLRSLLNNSRIEAREALSIVPQICDALQYAHDEGIVHRDIKPENILLDRRGNVKVADFGLAKIVEKRFVVPPSGGSEAEQEDRLKAELQTSAELQTLPGKVMGTPKYMSPEQVEAPGTVDHRADIYALGVVFYQMLTGEMPGDKLQPPSKKVKIDVRLDEVVLRALEQKPDLRYQQASVLKTEVETIVAEATGAEVRNQRSEVSGHDTDGLKHKTGFVRLLEAVDGKPYTSQLAINLVNFSALGFLGFLKNLSYLPFPNMERCNLFAGFFGFFGLIGLASIVEHRHRKRGKQQAGALKTKVEAIVHSRQPEVPSRFSRTAIRGGTFGIIALSIVLTVLLTLNRHDIAAYFRAAAGRNFYATPFFDMQRFNDLQPGASQDEIRDAIGCPLEYRIMTLPDGTANTNEVWWKYTALASRNSPSGTQAELVTDAKTGKLVRKRVFDYTTSDPWKSYRPPPTVKANTISFSRGHQGEKLVVRSSSDEIYVIITGMGVSSAEDLTDEKLRAREASFTASWKDVPRDKIRFVHVVGPPKGDMTWPKLNALLEKLPADSPVYSEYAMPHVPVWDEMVYCKGTLYHYPVLLPVLYAGDVVTDYCRKDQNWLMHRLLAIAQGTSSETETTKSTSEEPLFGPEHEVILLIAGTESSDHPGFLDLESGRTLPLFERFRSMSYAEVTAWMTAEGMDLCFCEISGWRDLDDGRSVETRLLKIATPLSNLLQLYIIPPDQQADISPEELNYLLSQPQMDWGTFTKNAREYYLPDSLPDDYALAFRTANNVTGILRIAGFEDNPRRVKLRYRLVWDYRAVLETTYPSKIHKALAITDALTPIGVALEQAVENGDRGTARRLGPELLSLVTIYNNCVDGTGLETSYPFTSILNQLSRAAQAGDFDRAKALLKEAKKHEPPKDLELSLKELIEKQREEREEITAQSPSFGPLKDAVIEKQLPATQNWFYDLDNERFVMTPEELRNELLETGGPPEYHHHKKVRSEKLEKWIKKNSIDIAHYGDWNLKIYGGLWSDPPGGDWDAITPDALIRTVRDSEQLEKADMNSGLGDIRLLSHQSSSGQSIFRTRDGIYGKLRILPPEKDGGAIIIRYKLVQ